MRCQKALFCAYRTDQYADPDGFMISLGAVLEDFPDEVVMHVTGPKTGIQRRLKWPPTISEVIEACEDQMAYLEKLRRPKRQALDQLPAPSLSDRPPGSCATIFVPEGHAKYPGLVKWSETAEPLWWKFGKSSDNRNGIWVSLNAWENVR